MVKYYNGYDMEETERFEGAYCYVHVDDYDQLMTEVAFQINARKGLRKQIEVLKEKLDEKET